MSHASNYVLVGLLCAGCGSVVAGPNERDAGTQQDARVLHDSAGDVDGDRVADVVDSASPCLAAPPVDGEACTPPVVACERGSSEFLVCDTYAQCNDGVWRLQGPEAALCAADTSVCQGSAPVVGEPCSQAAASAPGCDTADGMWCYCYSNASSSSWICTPHGPGCPSPRPRLGAPCAFDANAQCSYAGVDIMVCAAGVWSMRVPE